MKIRIVTDEGLAQGIATARYNLANPEQFMERYKQPPSMRQAILESHALQLVVLLELQRRRAKDGPLDCTHLEAFESG